jgi:hypothetical protein
MVLVHLDKPSCLLDKQRLLLPRLTHADKQQAEETQDLPDRRSIPAFNMRRLS